MGQASINPKVETVDELVERRKRLHLGMCKLLQEALSVELSQADYEIKRPGTETQVLLMANEAIILIAGSFQIGCLFLYISKPKFEISLDPLSNLYCHFTQSTLTNLPVDQDRNKEACF
jgi:hypothetical protein